MRRCGRLRAMKPMVSGMKVPAPTPARNCAVRKAVRLGDKGPSKLAMNKSAIPYKRILLTLKMAPR